MRFLIEAENDFGGSRVLAPWVTCALSDNGSGTGTTCSEGQLLTEPRGEETEVVSEKAYHRGSGYEVNGIYLAVS